MASVPITFQGMMYPRDKSVKPYPFTALGMASITGLEVGGGPVLPPDQVPPDEVKPPLVIWGGPFDPPHPEHPIVLPDPILPPTTPPDVPVPPHEGWNWSAVKSGWYYLYVPAEGAPQPKK